MGASSETWVVNTVIFTQNSERQVLKGHLKIQEGRIAEITKNLPDRLSHDAKIIDASGLTLIPGFVHAHIHLCQTLFRNQADDLELLDWLSKKIWIME
jgi:5-methylthioadenosine/S-adenosylhomocysteine deaminase